MPRKKKVAVKAPVFQPAVNQAPVFPRQNNNVLYLILVVLLAALGYMFFRMTTLEKKLASAGTAAGTVESPLSVDKLKQYAKELKLNTGKFNKCLDGDEKKNAVTEQENYGASVGIQGTPGFFVNGKLLAGAFPANYFKEIIDKELAGTGSENCTDYSTDLQTYCSDPQNKPFDPAVKTLDLKGGQSTGPVNAPIQLVEFSDFECPYCIRAYPTVEQIMKDYKGKIRLTYMQFPLTSIHPNAEKAAEASLCAADQGKFWDFYHKVFTLEEATAQ